MFYSANIQSFIMEMEQLVVFTSVKERIITISASDFMRKRVDEIVSRLYIS
jgi:hypothetical protein